MIQFSASSYEYSTLESSVNSVVYSKITNLSLQVYIISADWNRTPIHPRATKIKTKTNTKKMIRLHRLSKIQIKVVNFPIQLHVW